MKSSSTFVFNKSDLSKIFSKRKNSSPKVASDEDSDEDSEIQILEPYPIKKNKIEVSNSNNNNNTSKFISDARGFPDTEKLPKWEKGGDFYNKPLRSDGSTEPLDKWDKWTEEYKSKLLEREEILKQQHPYYAFAMVLSGMLSTSPLKFFEATFLNVPSEKDKEAREQFMKNLELKKLSLKDIPQKLQKAQELLTSNINKRETSYKMRADVDDKKTNYQTFLRKYLNNKRIELFKKVKAMNSLDLDILSNKLDDLYKEYFLNGVLYESDDLSDKIKYNAISKNMVLVSTTPNEIPITDTLDDFNEWNNQPLLLNPNVEKLSNEDIIFEYVYDLLKSLVLTDLVSKSGYIQEILEYYPTYRSKILEKSSKDEIFKTDLKSHIENPFKHLKTKVNEAKKYLIRKPSIEPIKKDGLLYLSESVITVLSSMIQESDKAATLNQQQYNELQKRQEELSKDIYADVIPVPPYEISFETSFNSLNTGIISLKPVEGPIKIVYDTIKLMEGRFANPKIKEKDINWFITNDKVLTHFARAVSFEIQQSKINFGTSYHHENAPHKVMISKASAYNVFRMLKL